MTKKLLLSLGAALALSASATTYKTGEAFAYKFDPTVPFFTWIDGQYPVNELMGQASLEYGFGMASAWFAQMLTENKNDEGINTMCPVVEDPWNAGSYVVRMQTARWDAFGNFNFALPQVNEPSRIRVIYRVDNSVENTWYTEGSGKPFAVKLMDDGDQDTPDYPQVTEYNFDFWNNPGWRVVEFVDNLADEQHYISILFDGGGLSCQKNVPFYVKEVSVVPLSKLTDYTAPEDNKSLTVVNELPDLVEISDNAGGDMSDAYKLGEAFCYDFDPTVPFFTWIDGQYPVNELMGQASLEYGFGMASAWFAQMLTENKNDEGINTMCPVVEDPWNAGSYVVRMQTARWDAFGNFNFALPQVNEPSRIRVIYRVDNSVENTWYTEGSGKPFAVKLMDDGDQDTPDYPQVTEFNFDFWDNPGWRVVEFVDNLADEQHYISILFDGGGLSCQKNVPFYVKEVSVVPLSKLTDYTAPEDNKSLTVVNELPELVKVDRTAGVESVEDAIETVAITGMTGAVAVNGFEGTVEVYNLVGQLTAKAAVNGAAEIAVPAGVAIVKAGNTVTKVVVR